MFIRARDNNHWRKSRLAARLLIRASERSLTPRQATMAHLLGRDPEVLNRLIKQALMLFHGHRPHSISLA